MTHQRVAQRAYDVSTTDKSKLRVRGEIDLFPSRIFQVPYKRLLKIQKSWDFKECFICKSSNTFACRFDSLNDCETTPTSYRNSCPECFPVFIVSEWFSLVDRSGIARMIKPLRFLWFLRCIKHDCVLFSIFCVQQNSSDSHTDTLQCTLAISCANSMPFRSPNLVGRTCAIFDLQFETALDAWSSVQVHSWIALLQRMKLTICNEEKISAFNLRKYNGGVSMYILLI